MLTRINMQGRADWSPADPHKCYGTRQVFVDLDLQGLAGF
jgi:hypothetical protein